MLGVEEEEVVVSEEELMGLKFGHRIVEAEVVAGTGLVEWPEPEVGLGVRAGRICLTG